MTLPKQEIAAFQEKILSWYAKNKRELPWREIPFDPVKKQRDPYKILVSEVMAQQTQLSRVVPKYTAWLERFPTLESLAEAPTREVLLSWSGLGYNRRAINLQRATQVIRDTFAGIFPRTYGELSSLPGVGEYTANALLCFAFNEQVAIIDTNVRRVILTQFPISNAKFQMPNTKRYFTDIEVREIAGVLLPQGRAYEWNQALMDYAAAVLKKEKIPIPKQSPFRSSNRFYRGQIVKILVREHTVFLDDLWQYFEKINPLDKARLEGIVKQMEKDGLIRIRGKKVMII